jgi:hypothetical protein
MTQTALNQLLNRASHQLLNVQARFADFFSRNGKDTDGLTEKNMEALLRDFAPMAT